MISRNDPCFCKSGKKWKKCCYPKQPPLDTFEQKAVLYKKRYNILLKTPEQIEGIRRSCQLSAKILQELCKFAKAGVTTNEINDLAVKLHKEHGAIPAPLGYGNPPFPKAICTSLNEVICHGIPDDVPLQDGDILNIDNTCILDGYHGDCSEMVVIGDVSDEKKLVIDVAKKSLDKAISVVKPGALLHEIGDAIEGVAKSYGCSVVYEFVGHGVGVNFHEEPQVCHHKNHSTTPLEEGMTFTIEPMINAGLPEGEIDDTEWVARTIDRRASAQVEHTLLVTKTGVEILTK